MKRVSFAVVAFGSLFACASIVGLDASDPPLSGTDEPPGTGSSSGTGTLSQDGITISPKDLGLPTFKCDSSSMGVITLANDSDEPQDYEATLPANDAFTIKSGGKGTVKAHDSVTITIEGKTTKPVPATAEVAIKTKSKVGTVTVKAEVKGATLAVTPETANFGLVKDNQVSAPINAIFANEGSEPVTVTGFDGPAEKDNFALPATVVVPPHGTITQAITMKAGAAGPGVTAAVTPTVDDESLLCGVARPIITLSGQRTSDEVLVNPVSADFGGADCNKSSGAKQVITITNFSVDFPAQFTATLPTPSRFHVDKASGTVEKGSLTEPTKLTLTIDVANAGNKTGPVSETLTVATDANGKQKSVPITLTLNVSGADITFDPPTIADPIQDGDSKSAKIRNAGNSTICLSLNGDSHFKPTVPPFQTSIALVSGGGSATVDVSFTSATGGDFNGKISLDQGGSLGCIGSPTAALCNPLPQLAVSGHRN